MGVTPILLLQKCMFEQKIKINTFEGGTGGVVLFCKEFFFCMVLLKAAVILKLNAPKPSEPQTSIPKASVSRAFVSKTTAQKPTNGQIRDRIYKYKFVLIFVEVKRKT